MSVGVSVFLIIIGLILLFIAIKLVKKISKMIFFILILGGLYSFSKGLIDVGTVLNWWTSLFH